MSEQFEPLDSIATSLDSIATSLDTIARAINVMASDLVDGLRG